MKNRIKRIMGKGKFVILTALVLGIGFFLFLGDSSHAADSTAAQIYITYNGADLDSGTTYDMDTGEMMLVLRSEGNVYETDDDYTVEWSVQGDAKNKTASISKGTTKMIGIVKALSPGTANITVTVTDRVGGTVMAIAYCTINVKFSIDTSKDNTLYKYVNKTDETNKTRSLVLYTDSGEQSLTPNIGSAAEAQWTSANDEVVKVGQKTGKVTPVGAGTTTITATYTYDTNTYTDMLKVYVIPRVSTTNEGNYTKGPLPVTLTSGGKLYTDTVFTSNTATVKGKIVWVVKQDDGKGNSVVIADSLDNGKTSDLISITPTSSFSNELRVEGTAGEYDIYFYACGSYDATATSGVYESAYVPTSVHLTIKSEIEDRSEILGIGDVYNFAESYNMTVTDFNANFNVKIAMKQGSENYAEYASYNGTTTELTTKAVGELVATLTIKSGRESYVRNLLGLASDAVLPTSFVTNITVTDNIQLNRSSMTIVVGQTEQLSVKLNNTYSGGITWSSSDPSYVTVDEATGLVKGVKVTTTDVVVTATLDAGDGIYKTATCNVKVEATVSGFTLDPSTDQKMLVGDHIMVVANIKQTVTVAPLDWISSNEKVFTVEKAADGKSATLTAVGGGTATLTVYNTVNNEHQNINVTVRVPINQISFKSETLSVEYYKLGYNLKDEVTTAPTNATDTALTWTSQNTSVVTVDKDGYMTLVGPGTTLVSVYPEYNPYNVMASCLVTVIGTPSSMTISQTDVTMNVGDSSILEVAFTPANTATNITWTPNDAGIVTISYDSDRKLVTLTGKAPGSTNINVVTTEGLISNIKVTVKQPSTALSLTPKEMTIQTGTTSKVSPVFTPTNSTDTITWSSYNTSVASVDANGNVTGVKSGTTFIQATAYNGKVAGPTAVIQVIVQDGVKGVTLDEAEKTVLVGNSIVISPTFTPDTAYDKGMSWTASNGNIMLEAAGESDVKVTGVKAGNSLVTGTSSDGGYTVACLITVKPKSIVSNTKVTVSPTSKYLKLGKSFFVTATVTGTSNKKVKWSSSNKKIAKVTSDGKVTGKKVGTAYIKATAADGSGAYARCRVRVVRKVTKITFNRYSGKLLVGNTLKIKATVKPKNATIKSLKWSSDNKAVATVSSSGRVLGVGEGIAKIKAKTKDGSGKSATCIIRVSEPVEATGVTVANSQITVVKGKTAQSGITLNPTNSTTKIKYYSDNKKVATVNKYGKIKTKRVGQATIYGKTSNGLYGYCDVLVVDLNRKAVTLRQYDTAQLAVNEVSSGVTWYSKDTSIATVSSSGLVTGRKKGKTTVYAVVNGVKLGCRVKVKKIK